MNKHLISAVTLAAMVAGTLSPAIVSAQGRPSPLPTPKVRPSPSVRKEDQEEAKEQRKERLSAARTQRIKSWWNRAVKRLENLIARQERIARKIQERINKLKERGRDVTQLQKDLDAAKAKIEAAKKALTDATAQVDGILANNEPKEALRKLRELHKGVLGRIREAHAALIKVLASTRGLSVTPTPSASPTASPSVSPSPSPTASPTSSPTPTP